MSPRRYAGWEPASYTETLPDGRTRVTREPEWDWVDRAILAAWHRLHRDLCRMCGRPMAMHEADAPEEYAVGYFTCAATEAIDRCQAEQRKRDEPQHKKGRDPDRARQYVSWTAAEGPPSFT